MPPNAGHPLFTADSDTTVTTTMNNLVSTAASHISHVSAAAQRASVHVHSACSARSSGHMHGARELRPAVHAVRAASGLGPPPAAIGNWHRHAQAVRGHARIRPQGAPHGSFARPPYAHQRRTAFLRAPLACGDAFLLQVRLCRQRRHRTLGAAAQPE